MGVAGRLGDSLSLYFGDGRVFRDIEGISAGVDFEEALTATAQHSDAMIALIGRHCTTVSDSQGKPRLFDPDDWAAREIAAALETKIPVYAVLIEDAPMPPRDELPPALHPLVRHNAVSISDHRWASDVTRLAKIIAIDVPGSESERILSVRVAMLRTLLAGRSRRARYGIHVFRLYGNGLSGTCADEPVQIQGTVKGSVELRCANVQIRQFAPTKSGSDRAFKLNPPLRI